MAEKKFSDLTAKGAALADTDLLAISEDAGGGAYTSKSVTGANVKALVTDANLTTTDITTNDVSTSKHGFAPKAPNDTTKFLRGDGTWAAPSAGGLTKFTEAEATTSPNNTVYVDSLTAAGSTTNVDVAIVPKGTGAFTLAIPDGTTTGGNKRGARAFDIQTSRGAATQVASGGSSFCGGTNNTASGSRSFSFGNNNIASGTYSVTMGSTNTASNGNAVALGLENTASGDTSTAIGWGNTASGTYSQSIGIFSQSTGAGSVSLGYFNVSNADYACTLGRNANAFSIIGRQVYASGQEGTSGDAQSSKFILRERTTDNTATTITTNSSAASTNNQVILSNQSAYRFKGSIVGKQSGSVNAAVWDIDGFIVRGANAAATTLNVSNVTLVQNTPAWGTPTLAADTTNGGLRVQVTGLAATNIQWTAVIETTEVIYA
jgi:hypothetical protein